MLTWEDDRWHLDRQPIHAGCSAEIQWPDGTWQWIRIESQDCGRRIYAHFDYHGLGLCVRLDGREDVALELRWPRRSA